MTIDQQGWGDDPIVNGGELLQFDKKQLLTLRRAGSKPEPPHVDG
jgi:hypothetical protein